ncbi:RluA family pseudouridine synthase [Floccifex sp.]|uniref:RluA family pseudouridine synthase n=1 Tax=Floccifex sp. TaxID=2815810 RepID=UPI002A761873|nr:RluA family pseudouridine synthase [Floccifex sp.]MDD7281080.1 RluA family pseudouridine synthase [Erysipelotrichaceae bacterium]MDY2958352.1 RluA family pseudouridine synthase [Floccifex sp.]
MEEIIIQKNDANQRLDKYLMKTFPNLSKSMMYKAIRNKKIKVNRKRAEFNQILNEEDHLLLFLPPDVLVKKERAILEQKELDVVYEDKNYIVVNKEYGLLSQSDSNENQDCLVNRIQSYLYHNHEYDPEKENSFAPAICNRLDRNTTGLVIAAKNAQALRKMNEDIASHRVHKYYRAWCDGIIQKDGMITCYIKKENTKALVSKTEKEGYKQAILKYKVIDHREHETKVDIELCTGRFHQIRASFSYIGHPLIGDVKYGYRGNKKQISLQAYKLKFDNDLPDIMIK